MRFKASKRTLYFDCVLNAIVKGDEVVGVSTLARDVTEEREKERRFTELFETLQEGVYFSTPEGKLLDGNAALVRVLGYENKEELLALDPTGLNSDANQSPVLGRSADDQGGVRAREITLRRKGGRRARFSILRARCGTLRARSFATRARWWMSPSGARWKRRCAARRSFSATLLESFPDLILVIDLKSAIAL